MIAGGPLAPRRAVRALAGAVLGLLLGLAPGAAEQGTPLSRKADRTVEAAWPFAPETRWETYLAIKQVAEAILREHRFNRQIATARTDTFTEYPRLFLLDKDGNGAADFFIYHSEGLDRLTLEFGVFFRAGGHAAPYWLVFNCGPCADTVVDGSTTFFLATHQFVDRNADGAFDLYILNGCDGDGDGRLRALDTQWLYDDDFDGRPDRAESIVAGEVRRISPVNGMLAMNCPAGFRYSAIPTDRTFPLFTFMDRISADIVMALSDSAIR